MFYTAINLWISFFVYTECFTKQEITHLRMENFDIEEVDGQSLFFKNK